jgi:rfaE bifunctional protein kinase chain/domain
MRADWRSRLSAAVDAKIVVVGDVILDVDVHATAIGLSLETPTLKARRRETTVRLGGAALVARNALALGGKVTFGSVVGDDAYTDTIRAWSAPGLRLEAVVEPRRRNVVKERYWIRRHDGAETPYKVLQLDVADDADVGDEAERALLERLERAFVHCDRVVIADYRHGLLSRRLVQQILALSRRAGKTTLADSQISTRPGNHTDYAGVDVLTLNEAEAASVLPGFAPDAPSLAAMERRTGAARVVVKLGAKGCVTAIDGRLHLVPAPRVEAIDTCGAGDAFLAALALLGTEDLPGSLDLAVHWAALSTTQLGTAPPARSGLLELVAARGHRP